MYPAAKKITAAMMGISASSAQRSPMRGTSIGTRNTPSTKPVPSTIAKYTSAARMVLDIAGDSDDGGLRRLTFDMSGTQRRHDARRSETSCPADVCPFDGRVRPRVETVHYKTFGLLCHTDQVRAEARQTHARYGSMRAPAKRLMRQKTAIVAAISASRTSTPTNANTPLRQAKNSHVQRAFAHSWAMKSVSAVPRWLAPRSRHTSHTAMPMSR